MISYETFFKGLKYRIKTELFVSTKRDYKNSAWRWLEASTCIGSEICVCAPKSIPKAMILMVRNFFNFSLHIPACRIKHWIFDKENQLFTAFSSQLLRGATAYVPQPTICQFVVVTADCLCPTAVTWQHATCQNVATQANRDLCHFPRST